MTSHSSSGHAIAGDASVDEDLQQHFETLDQQHDAAMLGMWAFLATEVLFFGGLIMAYVVYRSIYTETFAAAGQRLDVIMGGINTVVLLASSLTMALAVRAAQLKQRRNTALFLIGTMFFGTGFLVIKAFEYYHEYEENLIPFVNFEWDPHHGGHGHSEVAAADEATMGGTVPEIAETGARKPVRSPDWLDPELKTIKVAYGPALDDYRGYVPRADDEHRAKLFFVLYFFMTGLHAIHLIIGLVLVGIIAALVWSGWFSGFGETQVEVTGLYWHFIDIVWVFLYPLLYLIDIHQ